MAVYRRESRRRPILALIVVTCLALIALSGRGNGVINTVRHTAQDALAPVQGVVDDAFSPVRNMFDGVADAPSLRNENARLKARVAELEGSLAEQADGGSRLRDLEQLMDIPNIEDATAVPARVVGGPAGNFERTITLNKGTNQGIVVGMPVVVGSSALVGKVIDSSRTRSTVELIDSPRLGVGVRTEKSRDEAVTQGRSGERELRLGFLDNPRADIEVGELVFTAGVDGSAYPPDLPVGRVTRIDRARGDLDPDVFIEPMVDPDDLVYVKALRWPPKNSAG